MTDASAAQAPAIPVAKERLVSLDALRGFDILLLLLVDYIVESYRNGPFAEVVENRDFWLSILDQFHHSGWRGFTLCDLIMPLFLFMAGAAIPFSLAKYVGPDGAKTTPALWLRIFRRVVVLWIFGMCVQGNLLDLVPCEFKPYSNTLQTIAAGYFFSCLAYLYLPRVAQYCLFPLLLFVSWAGCTWLKFKTYGGGSFDPSTNLAYGIDATILGRWMHYATVDENGQTVLAPWYQYAWIYGTITFVATTLSGMLAGDLLCRTRAKIAEFVEDRGKRLVAQWKAFAALFVVGVVFVVLAKLWDAIPQGKFGYCPIVKIIWTSSMTLYSSGLSLLLLAVFYAFFDICKLRCFKTFLVVIGTNAIAAYMLCHLLHFNEIAHWVLHGFEQYIGPWQAVLDQTAGAALIWLILWSFWKQGKFLRV